MIKRMTVGRVKIFRRSGGVDIISKTAKGRLNITSVLVKLNRSSVATDLVEAVIAAGTAFFVLPEIDLIIAQIIPEVKTSRQTKAITTTINPSIAPSGKIALLAKIKKSNKNTITEQIIR